MRISKPEGQEAAVRCPKCDFEIPGILCETCGEETPQGSLYCYRCGSSIESESEGAGDFENRILCSDDTCTGVINEKGVCGVCGKPYGGEPST